MGECCGVSQIARRDHGLEAQAFAALAGPREVESHSELAQHNRASGGLAIAERAERLLEQIDVGPIHGAYLRRKAAHVAPAVPKRGVDKLILRSDFSADLRGFLEDFARAIALPSLHYGRSEAEEERGTAAEVGRDRDREDVEGAFVVLGSLRVAGERRGADGCSFRISDGLLGIARRRCFAEVVRERAEVPLGVRCMDVLERFTGLAMESRALRRVDLLVEHFTNEGVREAEAQAGAFSLLDQARAASLLEQEVELVLVD